MRNYLYRLVLKLQPWMAGHEEDLAELDHELTRFQEQIDFLKSKVEELEGRTEV